MLSDNEVKFAIYRFFVETSRAPGAEELARRMGATTSDVVDAYHRLHDQHLIVLEDDAATIRMALPFSGVPTPHVVEVGDRRYFANCAWDALGVVAALQQPGVVTSHCARSGEPLRLVVGENGPKPSDWIFHSHIPAAQWWQDIVFT